MGMTKRAALAAALLFAVVTSGLAAERTHVAPGDSPSMGPPDALVRIVEFVDYQ